MPTALVTGASRGFGAALLRALTDDGWSVVVDARDTEVLAATVAALPGRSLVTALPGDVTDASHRQRLAELVRAAGTLDLLVHNASALGPSPLPRLEDLDVADLQTVLATNLVAPLALTQALLPQLDAAGGTIVSISSDAAIQPYPGWGGYGASKAALDQLTAILGAEHPSLAVYAFDPGDMRTGMHQAAFPGEDISDRPEPATVVPALMHLIRGRPPSGRYVAAELLAAASAGTGAAEVVR